MLNFKKDKVMDSKSRAEEAKNSNGIVRENDVRLKLTYGDFQRLSREVVARLASKGVVIEIICDDDLSSKLLNEAIKDLTTKVVEPKSSELFVDGINRSRLPIGSILYFTRKEVAQLLRITLPTLHQYTKEGRIQALRIGGRVLYSEQAVQEALKVIPTTKGKRS